MIIANWTGILVTAAILTLWIGSLWRYAWWVGPGRVAANIIQGRLSLLWTEPSPLPVRPGWTFTKTADHRLYWWFDVGSGPGITWWISIPLWCPAAASLLATTAMWRLAAQPRRRGHCRCGYDLTGLAAGTCPECGRAVQHTA